MSTKLTTTAEEVRLGEVAHVRGEVAPVIRADELGVAGPRLDALTAEEVLEELVLVSVPAVLVVLGPCPDVREALGEVAGQEAAEDGVAGVGRGRGEDRVVVVLLDVEERVEQPLELEPLVVPHAVDEEEDHRTSAL